MLFLTIIWTWNNEWLPFVNPHFFNNCNISHIRKFLSAESTKILVHASIMCRLDNYNSLLYGIPKFLIRRLQLVQNCAICGSKYDCITPLLRELHWLPIKQRIVFLLLTFKPLNDLGPSYIHDLLQTYEPYRNLQSSTRNFLVTPKVKILWWSCFFQSVPLNFGIIFQSI